MTDVSVLAIHDESTAWRDALIQRLDGLNGVRVQSGSANPEGFDLVLNATPIGMKGTDPLPLDASKLAPHMHVGCVISAPAITPLIAAARATGCTTQTGADMFLKVRHLMVDFLLKA
jgi:shikimate dehydrogenase